MKIKRRIQIEITPLIKKLKPKPSPIFKGKKIETKLRPIP
jgi:hypothetical protein